MPQTRVPERAHDVPGTRQFDRINNNIWDVYGDVEINSGSKIEYIDLFDVVKVEGV
jgi:hypothetical protein